MRYALEGLKIEIDDCIQGRLELFSPFGVSNSESLRALVGPLISKADTFAGMQGLERAMGPTYPLSPTEPKARVFYTPMPRCGVKFALRDETNECAGLAPFVSEGVQHPCEIEAVTLSPDRLQAIIHGVVGELMIAFYDPDFAHTRHQMVRGSLNDILFAGLCINLRVSSNKYLHLTDPNIVRIMNEISGQVSSKNPIQIGTKGMAAILPIKGFGPDFYSIRGPVISVSRLNVDWMGQGCWKLRVVVARDIYEEPLPYYRENADFEIDLFLTDSILDEGAVPRVGEDIEGLIWLQGRLWIAGSVDP